MLTTVLFNRNFKRVLSNQNSKIFLLKLTKPPHNPYFDDYNQQLCAQDSVVSGAESLVLALLPK